MAQTVGYNIIEINASDERTGDSLIQKIRGSISSNNLQSKPNLVIIDEIDGALNTSSDNVHLLSVISNDLVGIDKVLGEIGWQRDSKRKHNG